MNKKQIGRNIQRIRQVQNITQAELAEMVHLSVVHISHIETGASMPSLPTLLDICNALEATPNDILLGQYCTPDIEMLVKENPNAEPITQEDKLLMQNIYNYLKTRNKKKKQNKNRIEEPLFSILGFSPILFFIHSSIYKNTSLNRSCLILLYYFKSFKKFSMRSKPFSICSIEIA